MPQSLSVVYIHLIFSTKDRRPYLRDEDVRRSVHAYIAENSTRLQCPALLVGGAEDHIHILARFGRTITQADWVKELKRASSEWIKEVNPGMSDFYWQHGYSDFSISQSNVNQVLKYVANQEEHHRKISFQDEVRTFLLKHNQEWDERYVWD